jgi:DNA-binding MarR family transcriptional regulator
MSLEQEIKQVKFRNNYQKGMINIIYTFGWIEGKQTKLFQQFDLTLQQYNILRILRGAATPLSTLQIRERMLDKMSDTSRIVDRLVKKKLVTKKLNTLDKRLVDVTINDLGMQILSQLDGSVADFDKFLSNLNNEEILQLNILLDKIRSPKTNE